MDLRGMAGEFRRDEERQRMAQEMEEQRMRPIYEARERLSQERTEEFIDIMTGRGVEPEVLYIVPDREPSSSSERVRNMPHENYMPDGERAHPTGSVGWIATEAMPCDGWSGGHHGLFITAKKSVVLYTLASRKGAMRALPIAVLMSESGGIMHSPGRLANEDTYRSIARRLMKKGLI